MPRYDAYLLRVWRGKVGDCGRWASRLEHLPDGEFQRFGSLEELLIGLRHLLAEERPDLPAPNTPQSHEPATREEGCSVQASDAEHSARTTNTEHEHEEGSVPR